MTLAHPRSLGPGVRRVVGDDDLAEVGDDDGIALLRPASGDRAILVLHQRAPETGAVLAEADRMGWLDGRAGAPQLIAVGRADEGDEAVVIRMAPDATTALRGHPLGPERLVDVLAEVLRDLHALDVERCPLDAGLATLRARVDDRIARDLVAVATSGPYTGRPVAELVSLVDELVDQLSDQETHRPAMIHGGIRPERVWFDPGGAAHFTGWRHGGVGDRHHDLAAAALMVHDLHGPALVPALLDAYGLDEVEPRRLDVHQLLVHLLR